MVLYGCLSKVWLFSHQVVCRAGVFIRQGFQRLGFNTLGFLYGCFPRTGFPNGAVELYVFIYRFLYVWVFIRLEFFKGWIFICLGFERLDFSYG